MSESRQTTVTRLLAELRAGNDSAQDELFEHVYDELRILARRQRRGWDAQQTLGTTALVHEAYLKLVGGAAHDLEGRSHFFGVAAKAMRHVLCNHARAQRRRKRGGGAQHVTFDELRDATGAFELSAEQAEALSALDDALRRLEQIDGRRAEIVTCRFFGGLTIDETAAAVDVSPATVKREWALARAWLYRELEHELAT